MLCQLIVIDFAIVERAELEFQPGLTVLTGETGAGKSVLVDALSLAVGERAGAGTVRAGAERADVSAVFEIGALDHIKTWMSVHDLEEVSDECILRRVVSRDGRSRAFVNGRPVAVGTLRELGDLLVDIHGQHLHQSLLRSDVQRNLLDEYADHRTLVDGVSHHSRAWAQARREQAELLASESGRDTRSALYRYQLNELELLGLSDGEFESLTAEQRRLAHVNDLVTLGSASLERLEGENESAILPGLQVCLQEISEMCRHHPTLESVLNLLGEATIQVEEAVADLRGEVHAFEPNPERLTAVDERLGRILDLARKHRINPEELVELSSRLADEIDALTDRESRISALELEMSKALDEYRKEAAALSASRTGSSLGLSRQVTDHLSQLGMQGSEVRVTVTRDDETAPRDHGADRVSFEVSTNPGQPSMPLSRVASGGELSRLSLALQLVTLNGTGVPTVVFDEVDAGIGGAVAEVVGRQLRKLGERRQVLCVTHLAQVASQAHEHVQVEKHAAENAVDIRFLALNRKDRIEELARMIGGVEITPKTLSHAREMLERANACTSARLNPL